MCVAVRNLQSMSTTHSKVVDLSAYKRQVEEEQEVKMANYLPDEQDVMAFLRVLRYLQKKTDSEQIEIESNADGLTLVLTEFISDNEQDLETIDYTTISHKTFIPFPFMLVDLDPSELTVHETGQNTVELFSESFARMLVTLQTRD